MTIQFDQIPSGIRKPGTYIEFNTRCAVNTLPQNRQKVLLVGQRTAEGTIAALVPTVLASDIQAAEYFGHGSQLHLMAAAALAANRYVALSAIALDDAAAGVAATGSVTVTGPATAPGVITLWIGYRKVQVAVASGDTADAIASAITDAIADDPGLPVTSTVLAGAVTITAKNKGTLGNAIPLNIEISNSCAPCTLAAMSTGDADPDITDALDVVATEQYELIASAYNDETSIAALKTHLDFVSGPLEKRPGYGVFGFTGAYADGVTLASGNNSGRSRCPYLRGTRSLPSELAAAYASVEAFEEDPAMPLDTRELPGIHAPAIAQRLTRTEQENCLYNGLLPCEVGPSGVPQIVRAVTTYTVNASGVEDISMLDINPVKIMDYTRKSVITRIDQRFRPGKVNAAIIERIRIQILDVLFRLEAAEIVENVEANKEAVIVERNGADPTRVDVVIPVDIVNGLHIFAGRIDLIL